MRCNGAFRFDELVAFAAACRRRRALDGPLRADRRARRACGSSPAARRGEGSVVHARAVDPALLDRVAFPLGEQTKEETRAEAAARRARGRAARARARRRASSPATTTAPSSSGRGLPRGPARSSTRRASSSGVTTASGASRPGSGAGSGVADRRAALRAPHRSPRRTRSSSGRARRSRYARCDVRGRLYRRRGAGRGEAALPLGGRSRARSSTTAAGFALELEQPAYARRAGPGRRALRRRRGRRSRASSCAANG